MVVIWDSESMARLEVVMLYDRIINVGTIDEPNGKPNPLFALPSTVNWMHALALLLADKKLDFTSAISFYARQRKRHMGVLEENTVLEQLLLALHHLSALSGMIGHKPNSDFARVGILAWYYGISNAASAMIAAQNGSFQENHSATAKMWDTEIAARSLAMEPFSWRVSSLIRTTFEPEIRVYRGASTGNLQDTPKSAAEAMGAAAAYLSGTAKWHVWKATEDVRKSSDFKKLGVTSFHTKAARAIRNRRLGKQTVGFLHQASRYRGKANYREALFLAYGNSTDAKLENFVSAQAAVLRGFIAMAGAFASRKLGKAVWSDFVNDVDKNRSFSLSATSVWS